MRYVDAVGSSRVEPPFAKTFATRYGPPSGVRIWCLDLLTSYVVPDSPYTLSSKTSYNISMYACPSSFLIFRASWLAF